MDGLATQLGVPVPAELLELALTHRSFAYENGGLPHNERLEFLGDSILGQAVTVMLYTENPTLDEGDLAKRRASLVSSVALAEVARSIDLGPFVRLGRGEELTGGHDKSSILADTLEAIIGAVYLGCGGEIATAFVLRLIRPLLEDPHRFGASMDPKTSLQELSARLGRGLPTYAVKDSGPDHSKRFHATVSLGGEGIATGSGTSKKHAEMSAALEAWTVLQDAPDSPDADAAAAAAAADDDDADDVASTDGPSPTVPPSSCSRKSAVPELPEVEVVRSGLAPAVTGALVTAVTVIEERSLKRHAAPSADFIGRLTGARLQEPHRRGKFLWIPIGDEALMVHLGMSGQVLLREPGAPLDRLARISIALENPRFGPVRMDFVDQRIFGSMAIDDLVETADVAGDLVPSQVIHIARDPMDENFDDAKFLRALARRKTGIKRAILDQTLISGIGNIYADEALWASRIHYDQSTAALSRPRAKTLLAEVRLVLGKALAEVEPASTSSTSM